MSHPRVKPRAPPPKKQPAARPSVLRDQKTCGAVSPRKPAMLSLARVLLTSSEFLGVKGAAKAGEALRSALAMAPPLPPLPSRNRSDFREFGSRNSSSRSSARGLRRDIASSSHQTAAAVAPKMASCVTIDLVTISARGPTISHSNVDDFADHQGA